MGCERYEAELTDAAIGSPASPDLERHLAVCGACRSRLEGERRLLAGADRVLRDALRVEAPLGFEARLLRAVRHAPLANRSWWPLRGWALALAAGLGFLLLVGGLVRRWPWAASSPRHTAAVPAVPAPRPRESPTTLEPAVPVRGSQPMPRVAVVEPTKTAEAPPPPAVRPRPSAREPEVLVPPGREQALAQFVVMLRDERVEPPRALTEATDPQRLLPDPEPLEIPDLQPEVPSDTVLRDGRSES